jgi:hypothetical protein
MRILVVLIILITAIAGHAQLKSTQLRIYGGIGFHRSFFTRSDIHIRKAGGYDFTLYDVKAQDDPYLRVGSQYEAPQFTVLLGILVPNKTSGIEVHYDHAKYIAVEGQTVRIRGQINGTPLDKDTSLHKDFVEYEHTHGANHFMVHYVQRFFLWQSKNTKHLLTAVVKPGAGFSLAHTDSKLFGAAGPDKYHVAGYVLGVAGGLRLDLFRHLLAELTVKSTYVNYADVLLANEGRASQHWWAVQPTFVVGYQF